MERSFARYQKVREVEVKAILNRGRAMIRDVTQKCW